MNVSEQNIKVLFENIDDNTNKFTCYVNNMAYVTGSLKVKENGGKTAVSFNLTVMGVITVKADLEFNFEVNGEVKEPTINNYIDADDLSDRDSEKILERLMENSAVSELMNAINSLTGESM